MSDITTEQIRDFVNKISQLPPRYTEAELRGAKIWLQKLSALRISIYQAGEKKAQETVSWAWLPELDEEQKNQLAEIQLWENYLNDTYFPTKNALFYDRKNV